MRVVIGTSSPTCGYPFDDVDEQRHLSVLTGATWGQEEAPRRADLADLDVDGVGSPTLTLQHRRLGFLGGDVHLLLVLVSGRQVGRAAVGPPNVAVLVDGRGAAPGDDAVMEFERSDYARTLAAQLLEAADVMDAMPGKATP